MIYRKLTIADMVELRRHYNRLDQITIEKRFGSWRGKAAINSYVDSIDTLNTIIVGFFQDGVLRGVVEVKLDRPIYSLPNSAEVAVSVEQGYRTKGVGTTLVRDALVLASNRGIKFVEFYCSRGNVPMQRLARKFGNYTVTEEGIMLKVPTMSAQTIVQEYTGMYMSLVGTITELWFKMVKGFGYGKI